MSLYFTPEFTLPGATTSREYWSIEGVSLHQYGWNITTVGGDRYALPPMRGDNIPLAYRYGQLHRPKTPDQRSMNLVMWVDANEPATDPLYAPPITDPLTRFNDSLEFLHKLIWRVQGEQVTLTRRTLLTRDGVPTIVEANALVEVAGDTMAPTMTGRYKADFTMPLLMADPFFYGDEVIVSPINNGSTVTVVNPGHDVSAFGGLEVDFVGPLLGPRLHNLGRNPNMWVHFDGPISAGVTISLNVGAYTATEISGGASNGRNWINSINHTGARFWFGMYPGENQLQLTADDSGTGHAAVRYNPIYV